MGSTAVIPRPSWRSMYRRTGGGSFVPAGAGNPCLPERGGGAPRRRDRLAYPVAEAGGAFGTRLAVGLGDRACRVLPHRSLAQRRGGAEGGLPSRTSARTSWPSCAVACPATGPSATAPRPCSSRPSWRPRATPARSTGLRDGSASALPRDAGATTATNGTTSRRRTSGCAPSEKTGSEH